MNSFSYYAPTEIIFGCGSVSKVGELAKRYGNKAMLVTAPEFPAIAPLYEKVRKSLADSGIECIHFDKVVPNPTTDVVNEGAQVAKEKNVQVMVGLGGGSSIDTAKAIAVGATHPGEAYDYNCHTEGPSENTLPIIAIGTTAGTGSQCTPCSVITNTAKKDKTAIWHMNIMPKVAIVDPETTVTMPRSVTAQTGFDAFCHNFESYISTRTNPMAECLAVEAIKLVAEYLPRAIENPEDIEARSKMAWADTLGGLTNAAGGTTLPHGLGMQIGGHCPWISHGLALALQYPQFTRFTWKSSISKFAVMGRIFDPELEKVSDEEAAEKSCIALDNFLKKIGLWIGFDDLVSKDGRRVTDEDIREIADCGQVLGDYSINPRVATIPEMYDLLMNCRRRTEDSL